jgi:plastocyanin
MADITQLSYFVGPNLVYCTRTNGDSVVTFTIGAVNPSDDIIGITEIAVIVPIGTEASDITNGEMKPVSTQDTWEFKKYRDYYRAMPLNPATKVGGGKSLTFELRDVKINLQPGTSVVEIRETDSAGHRNSVYFPIVKIKSTLDVETFDADAYKVTSGAPVNLVWKTVAASGVRLEPRVSERVLPVNGTELAHPELTTTYTLIASGAGPDISKQLTITVPPPKIISFEPSSHDVNAGDTVRLSWNVANATNITISPDFEHEQQPAVGFKDVTPSRTTTYVLTAKNRALQTQEQHETVKIKEAKIVAFTATPNEGVLPGDSVKLSWNIESATDGFIQPIGLTLKGEQLKTGTSVQTVKRDTAFMLTAQNALGPKIANANVSVAKGWHTVTTEAPLNFSPTRYPAITLNFDGKIWVIHPKLDLIYNSADGRTWTHVQRSGANLWPLRDEIHGCVFNGKMWLIGGSDGFSPTKYYRDAWSSQDGIIWTRATNEAHWAGRALSSCFVLNNKMFISGGMIIGSPPALNDVWSTTDGANWVKETDSAFNTPLAGHKIVVFDNKAWAISCNTTNVVYASSDGKKWNLQTARLSWADLSFRRFTCCVTNDAIYVAFNDMDNFEIELHKMEFGSIWQRMVVPRHMQTATTLWLGFKNMPWSFSGTANYVANRSVVVIIP